MKFSSAILLFLIALLPFNLAWSNEIEDKKLARNFVNEVGQNIITLAKDNNLSDQEKRKEIISVVDSSINSKWISRFVLGRHFRLSKKDQIDKFTNLYRQFMINTYGPKFKSYNGKSFIVTDILKQKRIYLVKTEFLPNDSNVPVLVDFRVRKYGEKFLILDFITEGISLIETQRSEFNSAIDRLGMDGFLEDLDGRVKKIKLANKES